VVVMAGERREAQVRGAWPDLEIVLPSENRSLALRVSDWRPGWPRFSGSLGGRPFTASIVPAAEGFDVGFRAVRRRVLVLTPTSADLHQRLPVKTAPDTSRLVVSPMPGLVVSVDVASGEEVKEGQVICVIEAMKMQNIIRAERDGVIATLSAKPGETVSADDVLAEFA
jgi:propionyl-CoA carboxylase alpha chain